MANLNRVFLMGNLTRDPELRYTPSGLAVASFGIAVNTPVGKDENGNRKVDTLFVDVVSFGKQAETITEYLKKGSPIFVEGMLRYRTWEDKDGNRHSKHEIALRRFQFISAKAKDDLGQPIESPPEIDEDEDIPF